MKKRLFALALMLCMVLSILPLQSNAVMCELAREGNWVVGVDDRVGLGYYYIMGYTGKAANVTIPTKVAGYPISAVDNFTFMGNTTMKTLNVPDGITVLGLCGCDVETVNMGKNARIGAYAFQNCKKLKTVNIPDTQTTVPGVAFENCVSLSSITIPKGVESIGERAFSGCTALTAVTLPDSVTEIGIGAFKDCTALQQINIPAAVKEIQYDAFDNCQSLAKITVAAGNAQYFNAPDGSLCFNNTLSDRVELIRGLSVGYGDSYTLPSNVTWICRSAFSGAKGLKKLVIPENITWIEHTVFANCSNLTEIRFAGSAPIITGTAFENVTANVYYPGDLGEDSGWDYFNFDQYGSTLTWIPYCTGIHIGPVGTVITPPTCDKEGVASSVCDLCKQTYSDVLPTTEHAYGDGVVTKQATCYQTGTKTYTCTACGHTMTETIYMTEHNYDYSKGKVNVKSTCFSEGLAEYPCKDCDSVILTTMPRIDHIYEDNVCIMCGKGVVRIYGEDRYETSFKVAEELKTVLGVEKFQNIVVASGTDFPDALSGSYLATVKNAPILLVRGKNVQQVADYIRNNLASRGTVYLLGGVNAVPKSLEDGLKGLKVKRLGGADRYETNLLILQEAGVGDKNIIVCTGLNFADSLSASALGLPILLVKDGLYPNQKEFLKHVPSYFTIVGGTNAVNTTVENQLRAYAGVYGHVGRIAGTTRYETSIKVVESFFGVPRGAVLAYAMNFPDGLCGGPLAYNRDMALILTASGAEDLAADYLTRYYVQSGYVLGGTGLIRDGIAKKIFAMNADEVIALK